MTYLLLKYIHILSSTFLFGAGTGTALLILRASRQNKKSETETLLFSLDHAVFVDWFFTLGAGILQLITGVTMGMMAGYSFTDGWMFISILLFFAVFFLWAPAAYLQIRMRKSLYESSGRITPVFKKMLGIWMILGIPAFLLMNVIFLLMVFKRLP